MVKPEIKSGTVLLAEPFMLDPNFRRTALLLVEHNEEGSVGFVLNRPTNMQMGELIQDFPEIEAKVFYGGPVQPDTVHYLHRMGDLLEDSFEVVPGVFWGGDFDKLKFLIEQQLITPRDIRFFLGYSGWTAGQLKAELEEYGSWVTARMDVNYLFKSNPNNLWTQVMENKGKLYEVIADMPDDATFN
ncbi:MAG: YqgE/AlgH family protein [Bacteroidota bacterium]